MSHVDDGILHAYLDGALGALSDAGELPHGMTGADVISHLGTCADCRARLEAERAVRESAGAVLGALPMPGHHVPDLPALDTTRPRRVRRVPMGWAASVILALGAGWMGSEVWRAQYGSPTREESAFRPSPQSAAPDVESFDAPEAAATESSDAFGPAVARSRDAMRSADAAPSDVAESSDAMASSDGVASRDAMVSSDVGQEAMQSPPPVASAAAAAAGASRSADAAQPTAPLAERPHITPMRGDSPSARMQSVSNAYVRVEAAPYRPAGGMQVPLGHALVAGDDTSGTQAWPGARMNLLDARNVLSARLHQRAAFDSIIAREQSGRIHFASASSADLSALADQLFVIRDASIASIEAAREPGQTVVRVQQTIRTEPSPSAVPSRSAEPPRSAEPARSAARSAESTGTEVELITWRQASVSLNELVVTASRSEARPQEDVRPGAVVQAMTSHIDTLADGRREIVLGTTDGSVWIALRARLGEDELRALARRVTIR